MVFFPLHHGMTEAVETSKAASEEECDTAKTKRPSFLATFFLLRKSDYQQCQSNPHFLAKYYQEN